MYATSRSALCLPDWTSQALSSGQRKRNGTANARSINPRRTTRLSSFTDEKFNCFSCGEHGSGAIDLVMKIKRIGLTEAVAYLSNTAHSPGATNSNSGRTKQDVNGERDAVATTENKPFIGSYEKFYVKSDWLKARGLTEETLKLFGVGQYLNPSRKSLYTDKALFPVRRFSDGYSLV
jgi:DNA primase